MLEQVRISGRQIYFIAFCLIISSSVLSGRTIIKEAKQDAWLVILIGLGVNALYSVVLYRLGLRYPQQTLFQYSEKILGKLPGKFVGFIFVLFFLAMGAILLRTTLDSLTTALMPETPPVALGIIFLLVSTYAVYAGLEVLARISEIIAPMVFISLLSIILFNLKWIDLDKLKPILQLSPMEVIEFSLLPSGLFGLSIAFGGLMAYHNDPQKALRSQLGGVITGVILIMLLLMAYISIYGPSTGPKHIFVIYRLAQTVKVGDFFERLEAVEVFLWIAGNFVTVSIFYYLSALGLGQLLRLNQYQSITPFIGITMMVTSQIIFHSIADRFVFTMKIFPYLALGVEGFLTSFLLIVSFFRHTKT